VDHAGLFVWYDAQTDRKLSSFVPNLLRLPPDWCSTLRECSNLFFLKNKTLKMVGSFPTFALAAVVVWQMVSVYRTPSRDGLVPRRATPDGVGVFACVRSP
jgi:hypothetical protein